MKFFSDGGTPRPDLKEFKSDDEYSVSQEDTTNRTQPKNDPTQLIMTPSSSGFKLKAFNQAKLAASEPANKSLALISLNSNDWLFTQATAVCSVPVEKDGYTIKECANDLVNENGNAFTNQMMQKMYKTFIGSHNYIDHDQDPNKSHGVLLDSVLRKIELNPETGDYSFYVDTLIATNKNKDPEWAEMIETREVKYLSMGCESSALQCTKCGHLAFDETDDCEHMQNDLGMHYIDDQGRKRRIAALVSDGENTEGESFSYFIELSYLSVDPAFTGAVQGHVLDVPPNTEVEVLIPRDLLQREAFQIWKEQIKGIA